MKNIAVATLAALPMYRNGICSEQVVAMDDETFDEKIGIRKIKLVKPGKGTMAVVGSFATADNFLMEWCSSSRGWLKCKFEIEYLDEHILKGEYKTFRKKDGRVSLSHHIRSTFEKMLKRSDPLSGPDAIPDNLEIQFWMGNSSSKIRFDFLERYETEDNSKM
jgi:hypothetical protein